MGLPLLHAANPWMWDHTCIPISNKGIEHQVAEMLTDGIIQLSHNRYFLTSTNEEERRIVAVMCRLLGEVAASF